jgi:membrane dipeptidase
MKRFLTAMLSYAILLGSLTAQTNGDKAALIEKARKIHKDVITLDTHDDINTANFTKERNYTQDLTSQVTLPKMKAGGLDVAWFIVYTGQGPLTDAGYDAAYKNAIDKFDAIHRLTKEIAPDQIELALTSKDVRRIAKSGKLVAMIGVENAYPIGTDISRIKAFADRGARYMSLAHNGHSQLADSNTGERDGKWMHNGLSELGRQAVAEANKWGIMIDISHPSKEANIQAIKLSKAPVIASHSSARAIANHSRNLDDEQLALIKANGGVVQAVALKAYVNVEKSAKRAEASAAILREIADKEGFKILERPAVVALPDAERMAYIEKLNQIRAKAAPVLAERLKDLLGEALKRSSTRKI